MVVEYDTHRWTEHVLDLGESVVRNVLWRVLLFTAWAAAIVLLNALVVRVALSEKFHVLVGVALGLLLVFRTNACYERFWEARKLWGAIVNASRNLGRSASVVLAGDRELGAVLLRWTITFPYATMGFLRGEKDLGPIAAELPPAEVEAALESRNVPLAVAVRMTAALAEARRRGLISDHVHMTLDQNTQTLVDAMGGCERIHKTPLPFAYVCHLRRALLFYCLMLPFALLDAFGAATVLVTFMTCFLMLGIEEVAVQIEDPFDGDDIDIPVGRICATIQADLGAFIDAPPPAPAASSGTPAAAPSAAGAPIA